ncbi:hypothetical protein DL769_005924 [Monosporascus sp. CRB-8-3]|nr:hypothetical protein DL769_005924 [Monosporascus sp. CRB-8-3]
MYTAERKELQRRRLWAAAETLVSLDKQNWDHLQQFREFGTRARRRFFECAPFYLGLLGHQSPEDVHAEMDGYDWREIWTDDFVAENGLDDERAAAVVSEEDAVVELSETEEEGLKGRLSAEDRAIMAAQGLTTKAEFDEYLKYISSFGGTGHTFQGRVYDLEGNEVTPESNIDKGLCGMEEETDSAESVEELYEEFFAEYGHLEGARFPEPKWQRRNHGSAAKSGLETAVRPEGGARDVTKDESLDGVSLSELIERLAVEKPAIASRRRASRLARNGTEAVASGSAKGRERASGEQSSGTADIDDLRYTWYEKAKMTFWQAEALYMATRAQERIELGLEMTYRIMRLEGWQEEFDREVSAEEEDEGTWSR